MLPPALFEELQESKVDVANPFHQEKGPSTEEAHLAAIIENRPGMLLKWDPFGRDNPRRPEVKKSRDVKNEWSPEPLVKYLQGVVSQIDANLQNHCVPTAEKLDAYVSRLVNNVHRQMKPAPKRVRHLLQTLFAKRFQKIWNFVRNEKVRTTTPEELKAALQGLIDSLSSDFGVNPETLVVHPRPRRPGCIASVR